MVDPQVKALLLSGSTRSQVEAVIGRALTSEELKEQRRIACLTNVRKAKNRLEKARAKTNAERVAELHARRMELGDIPHPAEPARREACRLDLALFLRTYLPAVFYRPFDADALALIADIKAAMLDGGRKAIARPRGSGKSAICLGAALWAALYGHRRYLVVISATGPAAIQMVADAQSHLQSEQMAADFPEVVEPLMAIDGKVQRCKYQTYKGVATRIEIKRDCIVFPTLAGYEADGAANGNAGVTIQCASITGAVRGMHRTDSRRRWIRPDFVLLDDPQSRESATSPSQTDQRERIINGDIMGLAGHDRKIAACMTCTVICKRDLAERFLDRERHPEWRGQRTKLVENWGGTDDLWRGYDECYRLELSGATPKGAATAYYNAHRAELERGAVVMCESLVADGEVSALQHARNFLVENGEFSFAAECQNEPLSLTPEADYTIDARTVAAHLSHRPRGRIPEDSVSLVAAVDINKYAAAWAVVSATGGAVYEVIDYGFWLPKGRRALWDGEQSEAPQVAVAAAVQGVVHDLLKTKPYSPEVKVVAVDAGYQAPTVYDACAALAREYRGRRIIPARGLSGDKYDPPTKARRIRLGQLADYRRNANGSALMLWDSTHWHMVAQRGFLLPVSAEGAVALYGGNAGEHAIYAEQMCADRLERSYLTPYGKTAAVWTTTGRNEMGDVTAQALAALSCEGIAPAKHGRAAVAVSLPTAVSGAAVVADGAGGAAAQPGTDTAHAQSVAARIVAQRQRLAPSRRAGWAARW